MEDGARLELAQFRRWYRQAGTPRVEVSQELGDGGLMLTLKQTVPDTPGQTNKGAMPIPLRVAVHCRETGAIGKEQLVMLTLDEETFTLPLTGPVPVVSINRGFTAPVLIERSLTREDLVFLAAQDDDPFARYEALQELAVQHLVAAASGELDEAGRAAGKTAIGDAFRAILMDEALDDAMRGELMMLPSETYLFEAMATGTRKADPGAIHREREQLKAALGVTLKRELESLYARIVDVPFDDPTGRGARKLKTQIAVLFAASDPARAAIMAARLFDEADNMTDRQGALMVLCGLECAEREERLKAFYDRFEGNALVIDKWFTLQALSLHPDVIDQVKALANHPDFTMKNPNRVRSLYMAFAGNPQGFHSVDGAGYRMIADVIIALDPINPQTAARFVSPLGKWRRIEPVRTGLMKAELERIAAVEGLSRDTFEQVSRSLDG